VALTPEEVKQLLDKHRARNCKNCGKRFYFKHFNEHFCSRKCRKEYKADYKRFFFSDNQEQHRLKNEVRRLSIVEKSTFYVSFETSSIPVYEHVDDYARYEEIQDFDAHYEPKGIEYARVPYMGSRQSAFGDIVRALDWSIENKPDPSLVYKFKWEEKRYQMLEQVRLKYGRIKKERQMSEEASTTTSVDKPKRPGNIKGTHAMIARAKAMKILEARHQHEFDEILGDEREKIGLSRKSGNDKRVVLLKKLDAQEKKLAELRKQLEEPTQ